MLALISNPLRQLESNVKKCKNCRAQVFPCLRALPRLGTGWDDAWLLPEVYSPLVKLLQGSSKQLSPDTADTLTSLLFSVEAVHPKHLATRPPKILPDMTYIEYHPEAKGVWQEERGKNGCKKNTERQKSDQKVTQNGKLSNSCSGHLFGSALK